MIYIIMGVSGCGKSSLASFLSEKLGWPLHEGDDFHPRENIEKMARGEPLTDQVSPETQRFQFKFKTISMMQSGFTIAGSAHPICPMMNCNDRLPWLLKLHKVIERERCSGSDALVVCSALRRLYRQILLYGSTALTSSSDPDQEILPPTSPDVFFLFLRGDYDLLHQRMVARTGHYMKADLLRSQIEILEPPLDEENVLPLDIRRSIPDMAVEVEKHFISLKSSSAPGP